MRAILERKQAAHVAASAEMPYPGFSAMTRELNGDYKAPIWGEQALNNEYLAARDAKAVTETAPTSLPATVKRVDLFGNVTDTYATEGELNGWREQQSALVGRQGGLL